MRRPMPLLVFLSALFFPLFRPVSAGEAKHYAVIVTNISGNHVIVRPVVISHNMDFDLFSLPPLDDLVQKGDAGPLLSYAATLPSVYEAAVSPRSLIPGTSLALDINAVSEFPLISVIGTLATTENAFFAIQGIGIPETGERVVEAGIRDRPAFAVLTVGADPVVRVTIRPAY